MRLLFTLLLFATISFLKAQGPSLDWVKGTGGTEVDYGTSLVVDASGNVYTTGYFAGTVDFDPGAGVSSLTSAGGTDIFIQKLDASGNLVWVKTMGGTGADRGHSITLDSAGNIYTTGYFQNTVDFDPGPGTANLAASGGTVMFVQKLDAAGDFVWANNPTGFGSQWGHGIVADNSGNVYTTGYFFGTVDFNPGPFFASLTSSGIFDVFVQKLDATGGFLWVKHITGDGANYGYGICLDPSENLLVTGRFSDTCDFDPGAGVANLASSGNTDAFILKLDAAGNYVWAAGMGSSGNDYGNATAVDAMGNVFTTGEFSGVADFDPSAATFNLTTDGSSDIFIQKLDAAGNLLWAKRMGDSGTDYGLSLAVDSMGAVLSTGRFYGTVDFDPGTAVSNLTSAGSTDIFIQKLDASGNFVWAKNMGGTDSDDGRAIALDAAGNIYTTGTFRNTADFDPGAGTVNLTAMGNEDFFVQKLIMTSVAVLEAELDYTMNAFPNPTNGNVFIDLGSSYAQVQLNVYTAYGQLVNSKVFDNSSSINLEIEGAAGYYFVELIPVGHKSKTIKVLKK